MIRQSPVRCHKRLKDLENVRPAFMDEFEKLEGELAQQYAIYVQKFRNLEYLEHQLEQYNQVEQERLAESRRALERMHKRLREEELKILRGEQEVGEDAFNDTKTSLMSGAGEPTRGMNGREVYGSLSGGDASDTDSELGDVLHSDDSGLLSDSGSGDDELIDEDEDDEDGDMSDLLSIEGSESSSVSDNEF